MSNTFSFFRLLITDIISSDLGNERGKNKKKKSCCFHATHFTFYNGMTAIKNTTDMQLNDLMMGRVVVGVGEEK